MSEFPKISRAIPRKRYQYGEYGVTVLGDIESPDPRTYQYIMAFVPEGQNQPVLYVTCERTPPKNRADGSHQVRVINQAMSEIMDTSNDWRDLGHFAEEALKMGGQLLGLANEQPVSLL